MMGGAEKSTSMMQDRLPPSELLQDVHTPGGRGRAPMI
jgi:hypothetical protein